MTSPQKKCVIVWFKKASFTAKSKNFSAHKVFMDSQHEVDCRQEGLLTFFLGVLQDEFLELEDILRLENITVPIHPANPVVGFEALGRTGVEILQPEQGRQMSSGNQQLLPQKLMHVPIQS